jgi:hypothetical protein
MYIKDYIEFLINGEIQSLAVKDVGDLDPNAAVAPTTDQKTNQDKIRTYLNLANIELHKKFNILQKTMLLEYAVDGEEFAIPDDFLHAISCTFEDGDEIPINNTRITLDPITQKDANYSVLFTDPKYARIKGTDKDGRQTVILTYAAAPTLATSTTSKLLIPQVYTEALLNYAAYKAHAAITGDIKAENNTYYMRFRESCAQIEMSGLYNPDNLDTNTKLTDNGFI